MHLLLEHLPGLPEAAWRAAAAGIVASEGEISRTELDDLFDEAATCLTTPALAPLFVPDALAEVSLVADSAVLGRRLSGQIDRLILAPDRVLAVDFKTNAVMPDRPEATPEGLLRQLGAYAEMLAAIYPDRSVETAILWTRTAHLMPLPAALTTPALARAASDLT